MTLSPWLGAAEMFILWHIRFPLLTYNISIAFSPRQLGTGMHFQTLLSPLLKVPRMVLLSSLLWWELGTSLGDHGPGEWLSFWRVTSNNSDSDHYPTQPLLHPPALQPPPTLPHSNPHLPTLLPYRTPTYPTTPHYPTPPPPHPIHPTPTKPHPTLLPYPTPTYPTTTPHLPTSPQQPKHTPLNILTLPHTHCHSTLPLQPYHTPSHHLPHHTHNSPTPIPLHPHHNCPNPPFPNPYLFLSDFSLPHPTIPSHFYYTHPTSHAHHTPATQPNPHLPHPIHSHPTPLTLYPNQNPEELLFCTELVKFTIFGFVKKDPVLNSFAYWVFLGRQKNLVRQRKLINMIFFHDNKCDWWEKYKWCWVLTRKSQIFKSQILNFRRVYC